MEKPCCSECFVPSHDVNRGHVAVAVPESCKDAECKCHLPKEKCERDHSHSHCWNQGGSPACGIPLEKHTQCCLCDTPFPKQTPAPEKRWETAFVEEWGMELPNLAIRKQVIAFIASLLEEKAVEMIERKGAGGLRLNTFKEGYKDGYNDGMDTAAAILRR